MKKRIIVLISVALALISLLALASCGTKYTVTIDLDGGTGISQTEIKVSEGGTIKDPGTPTKEGFRFIGWYINDTPKTWDFEKTKVTSDMTLRAAWSKSSSSDVCKDGGPHTFEILEDTKPDCKNGGKLRQKCTVCLTVKTETFKSLGHDILETVVDPTCGAQGYTNKKCVREGCTYDTTVAYTQPTGNHTWSGATNDEYEVVVKPTKYTPGVEREWCLVCPAERTYSITPLYTVKDLEKLSIGNYKYTGGSYVDAPFVNISSFAGVTASSYYTVCVTNNAIDGDIGSYWSADTLADGANFTGEWILLTFQEEREIGAINVVVPNYTAWELGEDCYVEFNIELLVNGEWINVGKVSDKTGRTEGFNAGCMLELDTPYKANAVRATVSHSSRFAPAMIYEFEVFAHTEETYREPVSLDGASTATITGKYSEWAVGGAGALTDGDPSTSWWTDWRHKTEDKRVYADLEFPAETFVAAIQFVTRADEGRTFSLQYWAVDEENPDGHFVEIGTYKVPAYGDETVDCIYSTTNDGSNKVNTVAFTVNLEKSTTKLRLELIKEPIFWESKIFSFTPYTVEEKAEGVVAFTGCRHTALNTSTKVAPTCTEAGYTIMKCNCGYTAKSKATDALGHAWGEYIVAEQLGSNGLKTRTASCQNCDATKSQSFKESYNVVEITQYLKNAPAAWSHTLDDGNYMPTYEWAVPVFQKYKFRASMAMAITFADGYVSEWQEYFSNSGVFDLVSHSYNHDTIYNVGKVSDSSMLNDVNRAHYWFMNKFKGQRILGFATPNGQTSESAAEYLTGFYYAARIGDSPTQWYNIPSELTNRKMWGRLNSYVSKASQTEGAYTYVKKSEIEGLLANVDGTTGLNAFVNYMYNAETNRMQDDDRYDGTFWYNAETYVYEWLSEGSYNMHIEQVTEIQKVKETVVDPETGEEKEVEVEKEVVVDKEVYTFVSDNSGEYIMVHSELGSYEKGINQILDVGGWSIDCVHTFGVTNQIWTSYEATISKLEFLKKAHIWGASFTDAIQYLREYQNAHVDVTEMTDTVIKISLTDTLDDYMFNHALTVKVDIPDDWTNVTVTQNGVEIPLIMDIDEYYDDFAREACTIVDGFLYIDAVPDAGEIVVTVVAE